MPRQVDTVLPSTGPADSYSELIGFKAIAIALVGEVFVFPITESPPDERGIFQGGRICTCIML